MRTIIDEEAHHGQVVAGGGAVQRRPAVGVLRVHVAAQLHQEPGTTPPRYDRSTQLQAPALIQGTRKFSYWGHFSLVKANEYIDDLRPYHFSIQSGESKAKSSMYSLDYLEMSRADGVVESSDTFVVGSACILHLKYDF